MRFILTSVLLLLLGFFYQADGISVCYYGSWAVYRPGDGKFDVENIDPNLCTHIVFAFAGLNDQTWEIKVLDPWNELFDNYGLGAFHRFTKLKNQNPKLITLLAVGGWNEGSVKYSNMAMSSSRRSTFINSVVALLQAQGFDGLDVDWEYPGSRGGVPQDKQNFVTLLKELRAKLQPLGLLLTAAVSAGYETINSGYDVPGISKHLDFIHLMTYDFHGAWETFTHHNAPLRAHPQDQGGVTKFNVEFAVNYWLSLGAPASKLVMGMGLYGRCYTPASTSNTGFYAPTSGPGAAGPYTMSNGFLGYNEICEMQKQENGWNVVWDSDMNEPYTYRLNNIIWCGYDNPESIKIKAAFARKKRLIGTMVWSIETDDFHGTCGRTFNLIKTMNEEFNNGHGIQISQPSCPLFSRADGAPNCQGKNRFLPHEDKRNYWWCADGKAFLLQCPSNKLFDPTK